MNKIKRKEAVYNDDETECLEIGWWDYDFIEQFKTTCEKVPSKLPKNIKILNNAFNYNWSKKITGIEKWDTSNVVSMNSMFYFCYNLIELDLSIWNISNVVDTSYMFYECEKLEKLDLLNFDITRVYNIKFMFNSCINLKELNIKSLYFNDTYKMFNSCKKLTIIKIEGREVKWKK